MIRRNWKMSLIKGIRKSFSLSFLLVVYLLEVPRSEICITMKVVSFEQTDLAGQPISIGVVWNRTTLLGHPFCLYLAQPVLIEKFPTSPGSLAEDPGVGLVPYDKPLS